MWDLIKSFIENINFVAATISTIISIYAWTRIFLKKVKPYIEKRKQKKKDKKKNVYKMYKRYKLSSRITFLEISIFLIVLALIMYGVYSTFESIIDFFISPMNEVKLRFLKYTLIPISLSPIIGIIVIIIRAAKKMQTKKTGQFIIFSLILIILSFAIVGSGKDEPSSIFSAITGTFIFYVLLLQYPLVSEQRDS